MRGGNILCAEFVIQLLTILIIRDTVGTTTTMTETTETTQKEQTTSALLHCDEPCANCTTGGTCLQQCPSGHFYSNQSTTTTMSKATTTKTMITTTAAHEGTAGMVDQGPAKSSEGTEPPHPSCPKCIDHISNCDECFQNESVVYCSRCSSHSVRSTSMLECTKPSSVFPNWAVAVIVILSALILTGAGVVVFLTVRRRHKPATPPPLPEPGTL